MVTLADRTVVMYERALTGVVDPGDRDYRRVSGEVMRLIHTHDDESGGGAHGDPLHDGDDQCD